MAKSELRSIHESFVPTLAAAQARVAAVRPAFLALRAALPGWRWLALAGRLPGAAWAMEYTYRLFLRWRPMLQRWVPRLDRPASPR